LIAERLASMRVQVIVTALAWAQLSLLASKRDA
jgi:hypothetical protein